MRASSRMGELDAMLWPEPHGEIAVPMRDSSTCPATVSSRPVAAAAADRHRPAAPAGTDLSRAG